MYSLALVRVPIWRRSYLGGEVCVGQDLNRLAETLPKAGRRLRLQVTVNHVLTSPMIFDAASPSASGRQIQWAKRTG
jgi:hypothetical protein